MTKKEILHIREGEKMPKKFWETDANPVTGYRIHDREDPEKDEKKYQLKTIYREYVRQGN